jgi:hypothetical protein
MERPKGRRIDAAGCCFNTDRDWKSKAGGTPGGSADVVAWVDCKADADQEEKGEEPDQQVETADKEEAPKRQKKTEPPRWLETDGPKVDAGTASSTKAPRSQDDSELVRKVVDMVAQIQKEKKART